MILVVSPCFHSLHLLEKLVEWKLVSDFANLLLGLFDSLHLLEKLVEWKL